MKRKVYRMISNIEILENGNMEFGQKFSGLYFIMFGFASFFFKKKNKFICNKNEVLKIKSASSVMTGNLITITTEDKSYIMEMNGKKALTEVTEYLKNSELSSKMEI